MTVWEYTVQVRCLYVCLHLRPICIEQEVSKLWFEFDRRPLVRVVIDDDRLLRRARHASGHSPTRSHWPVARLSFHKTWAWPFYNQPP